MSFFPRSLISNIQDTDSSPSSATSFHPLFRLLDDFDNYRTNTNTTSSSGYPSLASSLRTFTPKFDVKEVGDVYELHGELPGIAQKDVEIEFSDDTTITIKGRTEHSRSSGTPPSSYGAIEGGKQNKAIEQGSPSGSRKERQPTVEDEENASAANNGNNGQQLEKSGAGNGSKEVAESKGPQAKYWVSERSVGEFSRSFTFPVRVDQEGVKASMKNGILSVVVPKAKRVEGRKIVIE